MYSPLDDGSVCQQDEADRINRILSEGQTRWTPIAYVLMYLAIPDLERATCALFHWEAVEIVCKVYRT